MRRHTIAPRENWQAAVEAQGLHYHSAGDVPYWNEKAYYELRPSEVDELEAATYALNELCLKAVQHVIDENRFDEFLIPEECRQYVRMSWDRDEITIYGRFDLAYDGQSPPKLLEYNADTPTSLLEAAVIQWQWLQDVFPSQTQFNSIHERLLDAWQRLRGTVFERMYFASVADSLEDYMNVNYLRDVAIQAGFDTEHLNVEDIGWDATRHVFTDLNENPIHWCFKLYPWEWMFREEFGRNVLEDTCRWLEPTWKCLLSNKAILPILWELFPDSPYLLEARFEPLPGGDFVAKPILGREGANVQMFERGNLSLKTDGPYDGPAVYQKLCRLPQFDRQHYACIGSWIVNGWSCGIGIREDDTPIMGNLSRFVPHVC
jgi:glutathionylspermidine synthase